MRRERLDRWVREHPRAMDTCLVLGLLVFAGLPTLARGGSWSRQSVAAFILLETVPLVWRRRRPALSTAVVFAAAFLHHLAWNAFLPTDTTIFISLYSIAAYGSRRMARIGLGFALLGAALATATLMATGRPRTLSEVTLVLLLAAGFTLAIWVAGTLRGTRRAYLDALVERTHRLELEREQQAQIAAAAERARIARELHDVVAHSLSVIIAQADGGRYAARTDPGSAVGALGVIAETGRTALTDMRRLLGVLRDGGSGRRDPQPGIDDIGALVESVRGSGLPVTLLQLGARRPVDIGFGLTTYRITQEALTNVLKHGGPVSRATVQVSWEPDAVQLVVDDDGRGASAVNDGHGQGLAGLRERARLYGGNVEAGPRPGGGFQVRARLPYPTPAKVEVDQR